MSNVNFRYAVANATGKEVIILDLYPGTGKTGPLETFTLVFTTEPIATNIVAEDIFARTETGAPVAVMCNPATVSSELRFDPQSNC